SPSVCMLVLTCCLPSIPLTTKEKDKACSHMTTTQCLPDEVCASSRGYEGTEHVLSAQGCVQRDLCGSHEVKFHFGRKYKVSHTCCCLDKCNNRQHKLSFEISHLTLTLKLGYLIFPVQTDRVSLGQNKNVCFGPN
uniref:UPAR/Ly6 domain-containing protein n=1 Tax=Neogobius melanostomus TaxID=47308 RepID=A0A8C6UH22_9GOBI